MPQALFPIILFFDNHEYKSGFRRRNRFLVKLLARTTTKLYSATWRGKEKATVSIATFEKETGEVELAKFERHRFCI